ncbi:hypothetical protein C8J57DRAFT_1227725 [Mycena rebaudengoi]|nr:hypothetical protein C8J57DRAFT_1227725 [Mycena rebaudengoi]
MQFPTLAKLALIIAAFTLLSAIASLTDLGSQSIFYKSEHAYSPRYGLFFFNGSAVHAEEWQSDRQNQGNLCERSIGHHRRGAVKIQCLSKLIFFSLQFSRLHAYVVVENNQELRAENIVRASCTSAFWHTIDEAFRLGIRLRGQDVI